MSSTITSKKIILTVEKLNLLLRLRLHAQRSLRDAFVEFARHPLESVLSTRESNHVLKDISFTLHEGDRLALLGVNGSGKTSLCRCLAGMFHPNSGKVRIAGECRALFDTQAGVIPELTGRENAQLLSLFLYPEENAESLAAIVEEATAFSELGAFLDAPYETYSLGMKARLFLSLVSAKPADLLILDEVYDSTDRFFQKRMTARLLRVIHESKAVIFVSHSAELVKNVCNRAIILQNAQVAFDGPVEHALSAYDFLHLGVSRA